VTGLYRSSLRWSPARLLASTSLTILRSGLYEKLTNSLGDPYERGAPINLHGYARVVVRGKKTMNVIFLVICTLSILFFVVLLVECSRPLRKSKKGPVVRKSAEASVIDSAMGPRSFVHFEQQMAEFLSHHHRTTVRERI
jgi:hypothetical protein